MRNQREKAYICPIMELSKNSYTKEILVEWHNCNIRGELRPSAFLNHTQEIAGLHANILGFGYKDLIKENQVWVLSRVKVKYLLYPKWGDTLTLETWHKGMLSLFGLRDFVLHDSLGRRAVVATTSWLIMNTRTRRIDRSTIFNSEAYIMSRNNDSNAIEEPCGRIRRLPQMDYARRHTVLYSDVDMIGHTNNAKYIEWITDSIEVEFLKCHRISEFQINFNAETRIGEQIDIYKKEATGESGRTLFFEGRRGDETVFEGKFAFTPCLP